MFLPNTATADDVLDAYDRNPDALVIIDDYDTLTTEE
jgi:hypothetical protein